MASFAGAVVPGNLDTTFGSGGIVITPVGSSHDLGQSVALQSDGKIVVAGYSYNGGNGDDFSVLRYNTDGTLDGSFGSGGKVVTPVGSSSDRGQSVALQSDGKIVVAGYSFNGSNTYFAVVRYNADGTLDSSFGTGGVLTVDLGSSSEARAVALQSDGKIMVAGTCVLPGGAALALMRCNADGTLDDSFGAGGKVITLIGPFAGAGGRSMTLQSDGKIVVVGDTGSLGLVVRYNSDGTLDSSFGTGGTSYSSRGLLKAVVQGDGKVVACGAYLNGGPENLSFQLMRFNADGSMDSSFGNNGVVVTSPGYTDAYLDSIALQNDGQIIVAGTAFNKVAVARYTTSGALDTSFGSNGIVTTTVGTNSFGNGVVIQSDGRIVVVGSAYNSSYTDIIVLRYLNPGQVPPSVVANAATNLTATTAALNGTVNPNGLTSSATFQYGTTTTYGSNVDVTLSPPDGTADQAVSVNLTGLTPGMTYHYRLSGSNSAGSSSTLDQVFTMPSNSVNLSSWKLGGFGDASIADTATPDGDGIAVLMKYALVLQPGQNGAASLPRGQTHAYAEGNRLTLVFTRDPSRNDITISVEASDNPSGPWTTVAGSMNGGAFSGSGFVGETDAGNGLKTVEVRDIVNLGDAPRRFIRIQATR